jgi:hypothetical protein
MASYYRSFHLPPVTWPSHCRIWASDRGAMTVTDRAMMFGDRPASNWAMRFSGAIAHAVAVVANSYQPSTAQARAALRVVEALEEDGTFGPEVARRIHTFVSCFIDDFPL